MNSYDNKLEQLEHELSYIQKRIEQVKKEKELHESKERKDNLIRNSVKLD